VAKTQTASETKEQEETFYAKEKDRLAYDAAHRYDSEVDELLNQISAEQKQIQNAQADINRLRQEPDTDNNANAIRRLQGDIYTSSLYWKQTCDRLDSLVRQHPEIACDRISNRPAPPVVEVPGAPTTRPSGSPPQNQNITQDTEKTRRGLI
jgi:predicted  nucleic acid-binding Zn-ribbon protein